MEGKEQGSGRREASARSSRRGSPGDTEAVYQHPRDSGKSVCLGSLIGKVGQDWRQD